MIMQDTEAIWLISRGLFTEKGHIVREENDEDYTDG